jgi:hypothetical protein
MYFPYVPPNYLAYDRLVIYGLPCAALLALLVFAATRFVVIAWTTVGSGAAKPRDLVWPRPQAPVELRLGAAQLRDQFHLPIVFYGLALALSFLWPPMLSRPESWVPPALLAWAFVLGRLVLYWDRQRHGVVAGQPRSYGISALVLGLLVIAAAGLGLLVVLALWPLGILWLATLAGGKP